MIVNTLQDLSRSLVSRWYDNDDVRLVMHTDNISDAEADNRYSPHYNNSYRHTLHYLHKHDELEVSEP